MRSEAEIRREAEKRFHRWVFLLLNGGLWIATGTGLYLYYRMQGGPAGWTGSVIIVLLLWGMLLGLHFLRTIYVELREWLVRRAIDRERQYYLMGDVYEKRKRNESLPRLGDDGESLEDALVDFPASDDLKVKHGR